MFLKCNRLHYVPFLSSGNPHGLTPPSVSDSTDLNHTVSSGFVHVFNADRHHFLSSFYPTSSAQLVAALFFTFLIQVVAYNYLSRVKWDIAHR